MPLKTALAIPALALTLIGCSNAETRSAAQDVTSSAEQPSRPWYQKIPTDPPGR